jgi:hypothetical protein
MLERFVHQDNLRRLRDLLERMTDTDKAQRREIKKLLAEEEAKDRQSRLEET